MKFRVILADPPWLYNDARTHKSAGMARSAYECMSVDQLCAIDVQSVTDEDCMLCMWATLPKLPQAFAVMNAWGFQYVTCAFVWVKARPTWPGFATTTLEREDIYSGIGHYTNANAELVLLGRHGSYWRDAADVKQVIISPRGAHSEKPREVIGRIERLFGDVPRLEMFARTRRIGWITIGNEIDGKTINDAILELAEA